ncbi:MAG TPA: hypothetical protein VHF87_20315 [Methylomirabilota bacterium]|nr:hypothetical protein [Methylomirabilota bacterium]
MTTLFSSASPESGPAGLPVLEGRRPGPGRLAGFILLFLAVASGLAAFSAFPWTATPPDLALLKVAFKHVSAPVEAGTALSREEIEKLPRHMRPQAGQSGASTPRRDTVVRITLDDGRLLERTYRPSGLRHDGPTFVYEELVIPLGHHVLDAALAEAGGAPVRSDATSPPGRRLVAELEVKSRQVLLLELSDRQALILRGHR